MSDVSFDPIDAAINQLNAISAALSAPKPEGGGEVFELVKAQVIGHGLALAAALATEEESESIAPEQKRRAYLARFEFATAIIGIGGAGPDWKQAAESARQLLVDETRTTLGGEAHD